jgi:hypothetical protein
MVLRLVLVGLFIHRAAGVEGLLIETRVVIITQIRDSTVAQAEAAAILM